MADRRAKPPASNGYVEVHHILPRCMDGGDEPENLIRLRPEDHFFAHLLLAKAFGSASLWGAVFIMAERAGGAASVMTRVRRLYGLARRGFATAFVGRGHPLYDHREFDFVHRDGASRHCTKYELCVEFGLDVRNLSNVGSGRKKSYRGWALAESVGKPGFFWGYPKGDAHFNTDKAVRAWRHRDGQEFSGTARDLVERHSLSRGVMNVVSGKCQTWQGWYLADRHAAFPDAADLSLPKRVVISLKHLDGRVLNGPRPVVRKAAGITMPEMTMVLKGTTRHAKGWMLPDTDPATLNVDGSPPLRRSRVFACVAHPELGAFEGDASSFRDKFYPGDRFAAASAFAALAAGRGRSWRKWRLASGTMSQSGRSMQPMLSLVG